MAHRKVARLPVHNGPAGWNAILPPANPRESLSGNLTCDIAIIGGGFAGLSAARRLKQLDPHLAVVVLEAGRVAEGGAGRNSGFMIDLPHELTSSDYAGAAEARDRVLTRLNRFAIDHAGDVVRSYCLPEGYFRPIGKINGSASAVGSAANKSYAEHLAAMGEAHELLDARQMREITGTSYYSGGLFTPGTALIQPAGFIRGFAEGLEREGISIFESSPVTAFESIASGWALTSLRGRVQAEKVILANNGHLESFGFKPGRIMHIMLNACMSEELSAEQVQSLGGASEWGITPSDPMGSTVRRISTPQGGNRIVIRQGSYYRPDMQTSKADLARTVRNMRRKFDERFPQLKALPFAYGWSGHLALAKNSATVMQQLEPGLFAACVQNGLGTTRGTLTGIGAAELAFGAESEITRYFAEDPEPSKLPPHPIDSIGANLYLRWKEWQSRAE